MIKTSFKQMLGCLPKALLGNFLVAVLALLIDQWLGGPQIYITKISAQATFALLIFAYMIISVWSLWSLIKHNWRQNLVKTGPYQYVRHPLYAAIIFILNPALAILWRSWLFILAIIPIYFIWKKSLRAEEQELETRFGQTYENYQETTWRFFPNIYRFNKIIFYCFAGLFIFTFSFVSLNLPALYLRWATFEKHPGITYDTPGTTQLLAPSLFPQTTGSGQPLVSGLPQAQPSNYNASENSIIISRIGVRAPLVWPTGTTQDQLNEALNHGVILYPGSALPGQNGEVVLSGHSSVFPWVSTHFGQVFTLLDKVKAGDTVSLVYNHLQYDYRITGQRVVGPNDVQISTANQPTLKLITCWPVGTAAKRLVVYGELIR